MGKSINVSMPDFTITVMNDDAISRIITDCSFGGMQGKLTPPVRAGSLSMDKRDMMHHSSVPPHALMKYSLFFEHDDACAFHQFDTWTESHGCIHLNDVDAEWLYRWAGGPPFSAADPVA